MPNLNRLMERYEGQDLVSLAFLSSDFHNLEQSNPDKPEEFLDTLKYVRPGDMFELKATEIFSKIHVNGDQEAPYYTFFKESCPEPYDRTSFQAHTHVLYSPQKAKDIGWNYDKFLIARNGSVAFRYYTDFDLNSTLLYSHIDRLLVEDAQQLIL